MDSTGRAWLRAGEVVPGEHGLTRSEVSSELVFDPSGHVRLPIDDDEIIDRALAIEPLADGKVTLLTYDTGQFTRARNAGLQVVKLSQEVWDEPGKPGVPQTGGVGPPPRVRATGLASWSPVWALTTTSSGNSARSSASERS